MQTVITFLVIALVLLVHGLFAQRPATQRSKLDPTAWGVVYDVPATKNVKVRSDVPYLGGLKMDIYSPADMKAGEQRPAVVFLNAIGDGPGNRLKTWEIYSTWPRLIAAHGMVGISMDADSSRIQESLKGLFSYLEEDGAALGVDAQRLGVYAASANTTQSLVYLMGDSAHKGIRAAALYYGVAPEANTAIRRDLPVLFILAEGDLQGPLGQSSPALWQRVRDAKAPWTLMFAADVLHAFDAFQDDDNSRRIIQQTIAFWKSHLEPLPQPPWQPSEAREIVASTYGSDYQRTADLLSKYIAANPDDAQAYIMHGRALSNLRKFDEAAAAFEKAVSLSPTHPVAAGGLGQVRFAQKRYDDAVLYLSRAIDGGFRNSYMYGQLALAQLALNKNQEAINSYEKAFEMGIPPGANTRGLAYFNLACAYARLKLSDKAFEMLGKAVDAGFADRNALETDSDLAGLRGDSRFAQLLSRVPSS